MKINMVELDKAVNKLITSSPDDCHHPYYLDFWMICGSCHGEGVFYVDKSDVLNKSICNTCRGSGKVKIDLQVSRRLG